jgi:hypothetical protein
MSRTTIDPSARREALSSRRMIASSEASRLPIAGKLLHMFPCSDTMASSAHCAKICDGGCIVRLTNALIFSGTSTSM